MYCKMKIIPPFKNRHLNKCLCYGKFIYTRLFFPIVAVCWTLSAILSCCAVKHLGSFAVNVHILDANNKKRWFSSLAFISNH